MAVAARQNDDDNDAPRVRPFRKKVEEAPSDLEKLKLALWFIGKCGGLSSAKRVFQAACLAQEELEKKA